MDYKEKGKLVTKMSNAIEEHGLESNIPVNHAYWYVKRKLRLMGNAKSTIEVKDQSEEPVNLLLDPLIEEIRPAETIKPEVLTSNIETIPAPDPFAGLF